MRVWSVKHQIGNSLYLQRIFSNLPDFPKANISPGNDGITGTFPLPLCPDISILRMALSVYLKFQLI